MRIAVIGSGVSGLVAAHHLHGHHDVQIFEASDWVGGHAHTVDVEVAGQPIAVDTGFIVFNRSTYPVFVGLLEQLGVAHRATRMSFSVRHEQSSMEYAAAAHAPWALLSRPANAVTPGFWRMLRDVVRFNDSARQLLDRVDDEITLGEHLDAEGYSKEFIEWHLLPMTAAVWSSGTEGARQFPLRTMLRFFDNHGFLQIKDRPTWRTVTGGSRSYVRTLSAPFAERIRLGTPVRRVRRDGHGVVVDTDTGSGRFDRVIFATHSDQALALLDRPSRHEARILSSIGYQPNDVVLHTDPSVMPRRKKSWAAWNYHLGSGADALPTVSYWMNALQHIDSTEPLLVTLNRSEAIDPRRVLARYTYEHPIFTRDAVRAQGQRNLINGQHHSYFAGAYWGHGFHEDGARSGMEVAAALTRQRERAA